MKLFTLFSLLSVTSFAQSLIWSGEVTVANGNPYGGIRPRICMTANSYPLIMWGGGTGTEPLYSARWNGSSFTMPVQVTPNNVNPFIDTWAGATVASYGNTAFACFKVQPEMMNNIYVVKSTDGGLTWSDTVRVDGMNGPYDRFPNVEVTSAGNPVVMFMSFNTSWGNAEYVVTNSTDGGATFPMPVSVSSLGGSDVCDCCPAYMFIDGNRQIAAWRRNNNNLRDMWVGLSTNGGGSFTVGGDVDNTNWMIPNCPSSGPEPFLYLDTVTTVFMSEGWGGNTRVYVSTWNVNTQSLGLMTAIAGNYTSAVTQNYPMIAGRGDTLGVVWQQQDAMGNMDIYFSWSVTGAEGLVNNETVINTVTAGMQRNPDIQYANGRFHVTFQDAVTGNVIYKYASINGVGMDEDPELDLRVYPNPSVSGIFIGSKGTGITGKLKLMDALGKEVWNTDAKEARSLSLPKMPAGIYTLQLTAPDGRWLCKKLVWQ